MNVTLPDNKIDRKAIVVYSLIITVCIISIILVVWLQFFEGRTVETVGTLKGKSDNDYDVLKAEFDTLLVDKIENEDVKYKNKKENRSKDIVYTQYEKSENLDGSYDVNVKIPYININNSIIKKYNEEIQSTFVEKTESILKTNNKNSIYTVQYGGYMQDGILSVVIKATLQEGSSAQRTIIKTYNFNLEDNKEISLAELLKMKSVEISYAQNKIDKEIQNGHKKAADLKALGYPIFERNLNDKMYQVENVSEFYYHDGSIYVIFAYGNDKFTNEVDIAVI